MHRGAVAEFVRRVEAVGDDQWGSRTPCADWAVRDLVNHLVGEERWTPPLLAGSTIEEVGDALEGDLLGDDPRATVRDAAEQANAAVAERVPTGGVVQLSYGAEEVDEYVAQLTTDHLVHAWDLAAAIGADRRLDPELLEAVAGWFADKQRLYRAAGLIALPVPTDSDDPQARLLGAFGRDPDWVSRR